MVVTGKQKTILKEQKKKKKWFVGENRRQFSFEE